MSENTTEREYLQKLDQDQIHVTTRPYLNKVNSHTEPYEVDVFGRMMTVLPGVMSPEYDWSGLFMIDCLPESFAGQDVLEIGPGSGLVSVFVGLRGASSITAADINSVAVQNTQLNFEKFGIKNAFAILSDVFSAVPLKKYDSIIFNLPYHNGNPANDLEKGVIDAGYHAMTTFFAQVRSYLKEDGRMYIGFSQSGNVSLFLTTLKENDIHIEKMTERNTYDGMPRFDGSDFYYNCQVYVLSCKKG